MTPRTGDFFLHWTEVLTGLARDRVAEARNRVASSGFEAVSAELLLPNIDSAVAATLLVEGFDALVERGADGPQLLKKIRVDREIWGTWAEIRAADILLHAMPDAELRLEQGRSRGAHADLRFLFPDGGLARSIEVKAIGLSDDEVAFCERMSPSLRSLVPKTGISQGHAHIDSPRPRNPRQMRLASQAESKRNARLVPKYPPGLTGAVLVAHGSEGSYARRVAGRVVQAVRQLPRDDDCWVAVLWSNGAPSRAVYDAIRWEEIPSHVEGIVLVWSGVAFPHREIHAYTAVMPRDADDSPPEVTSLDGEEMSAFAQLVLRRFERSAGVRATLLKGGNRTVMLRDGSRRILPFNLLLDADPDPLARDATPSLWGGSA